MKAIVKLTKGYYRKRIFKLRDMKPVEHSVLVVLLREDSPVSVEFIAKKIPSVPYKKVKSVIQSLCEWGYVYKVMPSNSEPLYTYTDATIKKF